MNLFNRDLNYTNYQAPEPTTGQRLPPPATIQPSPPEPLTPEAQAIINKGLIAKIKAFRESALEEYQSRIDAATNAYKVADETTAKMVSMVEQMAEENAKQIAALHSQVSALTDLASTYAQVPQPEAPKPSVIFEQPNDNP